MAGPGRRPSHGEAGRSFDDAVRKLALGLPHGASVLEARTLVEGSPLPAMFLADLARLYGIERWTVAAFRTAFAEGALAEWKDGADVRLGPKGVKVITKGCPLHREAESTPSVCGLCQMIQARVTLLALGDDIRDVTFPRAVLRGDDRCEMEIKVRSAALRRERVADLL